MLVVRDLPDNYIVTGGDDMSTMKIISIMLSSFSLGFSTYSLIWSLMERKRLKELDREISALLEIRDEQADQSNDDRSDR